MFLKFHNPEAIRAFFIEQQRQRERLMELLPELSTKDGLLPISALLVESDGLLKLRVDPSVEIRPHRRARGPARLLINEPALWPKAAIRVRAGQSIEIVSGAPVRGVPFQKALEIVLREGEHKSTFWIPNQDSDLYYATLVTRLRCQKGRRGTELVLEAWEWIGAGMDVNYAHAILTDDASQVLHLDGALVHFSCESDAQNLFWTGVKNKGVSYEKYFRVDATLSVDDAVLLIREFFPIEEMVDEYFAVAHE
jgi:hypothetical protein